MSETHSPQSRAKLLTKKRFGLGVCCVLAATGSLLLVHTGMDHNALAADVTTEVHTHLQPHAGASSASMRVMHIDDKPAFACLASQHMLGYQIVNGACAGRVATRSLQSPSATSTGNGSTKTATRPSTR